MFFKQLLDDLGKRCAPHVLIVTIPVIVTIGSCCRGTRSVSPSGGKRRSVWAVWVEH
jgi:hypothetical protein